MLGTCRLTLIRPSAKPQDPEIRPGPVDILLDPFLSLGACVPVCGGTWRRADMKND